MTFTMLGLPNKGLMDGISLHDAKQEVAISSCVRSSIQKPGRNVVINI